MSEIEFKKSEVQRFTAPEGHEIGVIAMDGEPWFVALKICNALDIANARDAVSRLDDDERGVAIADTPGGAQRVAIISEAGLYSLILTSRKPEAKAFKRWITHEVLPQIRKTGAYHAVPQTFADALQLAADQARTIEAQALQIEASQPAVAFMDEYVEAKSTRDISTVGKTLGMAPKAFFAKLSEMGVMFRRGGDWIPYQEHLEAGRFEVKTGTRHGHAWHQARFTPKGVAWIAGRLS